MLGQIIHASPVLRLNGGDLYVSATLPERRPQKMTSTQHNTILSVISVNVEAIGLHGRDTAPPGSQMRAEAGGDLGSARHRFRKMDQADMGTLNLPRETSRLGRIFGRDGVAV
jgi:hypothetical protein